MLENLHVLNLALIDEADIDLKDGFNVMTGETGAGKSIVLGSINLALGAKANSDVIRAGKEYALVELTFRVSEDERAAIRNMGLLVDEDESLILSRKIMPGKSVCRINGETISSHELKELSGILLDVYGQHEHQSLLKSATYEKMLDEYAGSRIFELQDALAALRKEYKSLKEELSNADTDENSRNRQKELLSFEINEIESASLKEGEDEELEKRYRFLSNALKIKEAVCEAHAYTGYENSASAGSLIGSGVSKLRSVSGYDDEAGELTNQLAEIEALLSDFNRTISNYEDSLNFDEEEYAEIEERLNLINNLKSKYGSSVKAIMESYEAKVSELDKLSNHDAYIDTLRNRIKETEDKMIEKCALIHELRTKAAVPLRDKLVEAMVNLNFLDVRLEIAIEGADDKDGIKDSGYDKVEFLICLNPGEELRPMQNVASGGELSRIMLAIKTVFADKDDVPTLVFDEIDTGISGRTAYKVAEAMEVLSKSHQLIAITHLPQIASRADNHLLIEKNVVEGRTVTTIETLDNEASVRELARMLGGDEITEAALNNAREMKS